MDALLALSDGLAAAVQRAGRALCAVHARPRVPSSGVHWRSGLVVTASHTVRVEEDLTVVRADGRSVVVYMCHDTHGKKQRAESFDHPPEGAPRAIKDGYRVIESFWRSAAASAK